MDGKIQGLSFLWVLNHTKIPRLIKIALLLDLILVVNEYFDRMRELNMKLCLDHAFDKVIKMLFVLFCMLVRD